MLPVFFSRSVHIPIVMRKHMQQVRWPLIFATSAYDLQYHLIISMKTVASSECNLRNGILGK